MPLNFFLTWSNIIFTNDSSFTSEFYCLLTNFVSQVNELYTAGLSRNCVLVVSDKGARLDAGIKTLPTQSSRCYMRWYQSFVPGLLEELRSVDCTDHPLHFRDISWPKISSIYNKVTIFLIDLGQYMRMCICWKN